MKWLFRWIISICCIVIVLVLLMNAYSPGLGTRQFKRLLPEKWFEPIAQKLQHKHKETDFLNQLKLIYGTFTIKDTCDIPYKTSYIFDNDNCHLIISESANIEFYVEPSKSAFQINNSTKTMLIDTTKIKLMWLINDSKITTQRIGDCKLSDKEVNLQISLCNDAFNASIVNSPQLVKARKALHDLYSSSYIYVVQSNGQNQSEAD